MKTNFALYFGLTTAHQYLPRKKLIHLSGAPVFATAAKRTPPNCLVWRPETVTTLVPQDVYICIL